MFFFLSKKLFYIYSILLLFGFIFCSVSLVNHYNFRTYALDLGIYNNAAYDFLRFRANTCTQLRDITENFFADHFALIPVLVSPLFLLFGSYTMLLVQIAAILSGGYGIYKYISAKTESPVIPLLAMVHFFVMWGIYSALSFDYHDNVVAAMIVPWLLYHFEKQNKWFTALFFTLIVISKENMALWAIFICLGLMLMNLKSKARLFQLGVMAALATIYFIAVTKLIMPALNPNGVLNQLGRYPGLGNNIGEVFNTFLTKPMQVWDLFIKDEQGIKTELHLMVLLSGGIALLLRPAFLFMLIPVYLQKFLTSDPIVWGINCHYSIEFIPVISIALFSLITKTKSINIGITIASLSVIVTALTTFMKMENRVAFGYSPVHTQFYKKSHYTREFNVKKVHEALKLIPGNAKVSAQGELAPHLAYRDVFYLYPRIDDAEYIALLKKGSSYPMHNDDYQNQIKEYLNSTAVEIKYNDEDLLIVRKK